MNFNEKTFASLHLTVLPPRFSSEAYQGVKLHWCYDQVYVSLVLVQFRKSIFWHMPGLTSRWFWAIKPFVNYQGSQKWCSYWSWHGWHGRMFMTEVFQRKHLIAHSYFEFQMNYPFDKLIEVNNLFEMKFWPLLPQNFIRTNSKFENMTSSVTLTIWISS